MIAKICPCKRQIDQSIVTIHESPPVWTQDDRPPGDASSPWREGDLCLKVADLRS